MTMKYCPASEMIGDHFTKLLQGALFRRFRAIIMNVNEEVPDADLAWERELVDTMPQECVGDNIALVSVTRLVVPFIIGLHSGEG
mmetsp:Transcript_3984/g.8238  ORF Transcript_3984/g.8238 Transcript_3984/m.8238 type:complete len:85 (-) Transcript_3984:208-462(-)